MARKKISFSGYSWDDFFLIGIVCPLFDYQLCWNLNKVLGLQLRKKDDLTAIEQHRQSLGNFSFFDCYDEVGKRSYFLVGNKSNEQLFLPELGPIDFIFLAEGELGEEERNGLLRKIKELQIIQLASVIDLKKIKQKEKLIFE